MAKQIEDFDANLAGEEGKTEETKSSWFKRIKKYIVIFRTIDTMMITAFGAYKQVLTEFRNSTDIIAIGAFCP